MMVLHPPFASHETTNTPFFFPTVTVFPFLPVTYRVDCENLMTTQLYTYIQCTMYILPVIYRVDCENVMIGKLYMYNVQCIILLKHTYMHKDMHIAHP